MKEDAQILIKKADNDLKIAKSTSIKDPDFIENICFHCQQAVEKYLKAYLAYNNEEIKKIHVLEIIIEDCKRIDPEFINLESLNLSDLTPYAVIVRYDEMIELSSDDAKEAISIAEQVKSFVAEKILEKQNETKELTSHDNPEAAEKALSKEDSFNTHYKSELPAPKPSAFVNTETRKIKHGR